MNVVLAAKRGFALLCAMMCVAFIASSVFVGSAFAATVHGADSQSAGSVLESGEVEVLNVDGSAGETIFLSVTRGGEVIAKNLAYTVGENQDAQAASEWAGVATLDIAGLDLSALDGSYAIEANATRAGGEQLYSGALYGVYADLPDGTTKLIGTRVLNAAEAKTRSFLPAETLFVDGLTFRLTGEGDSVGNQLHFAYEAYDEATTVDGVIKYTDATGAVIATTKIPGLVNGEKRTVDIPAVVKADNGDLYRTVFFKNSVVAENPGQTSFSIYCAQMSEAAKALSGFYVATIKMVDEDGDVIATDSVDVTGEFVYTAPSTIYKKEVVNASTGETAVVTYKIAQSQTVRLSAANDNVQDRVRTITVSYAAQPLESNEVDVTFNLIDGSKRVNEAGRNLGTKTLTATKDNPTVEPDARISVGGTTFNIAGATTDYAYTLRSGEVPSVDVYYTPEGYQAPGAYDVTVNYVNFVTDEVIESHVYTSDPDENSRVTIDTPAELSAGGSDYVRLTGQDGSISHSYYSGIASYTVYYRNVNDELTSGSVINTIRVVYQDGTTNDAAPGSPSASDASANAAADASANANANAGANTEGAQALQLNSGRTYNVFDGEGNNGTLTNESGVNSNTERIEDSETPLASGFDRGASSSAASSLTDMTRWLVPAGIAVVAIIAIVAVVVAVRRRREEDYE